MLAESGIRLVDVVEEMSVKVCYNICCLSEQVLQLRKYHCGSVYEGGGVVV